MEKVLRWLQTYSYAYSHSDLDYVAEGELPTKNDQVVPTVDIGKRFSVIDLRMYRRPLTWNVDLDLELG